MPSQSFQEFYGELAVDPGSFGFDPYTDPLSDMPGYTEGEFDWLSWLEAGLPEGGTWGYSGTDIDIDPDVEGTQTTGWGEWGYSGVNPGAGTTDWMDWTGQDIAEQFAAWGFGSTTAPGASEFIEQFADMYEFGTWGDATDPMSYAGQLSFLQGQYAEMEANLWDSYIAWQDYTLPMLESQMGGMWTDYSASVEDIEAQRSQALSSIREQRKGQQESAFQSLLEKRRGAGRTGFGATGRMDLTDEMEAIQAQLSGLSSGAYQATTQASSQLETLESSTQLSAEQAWQDWLFDQESEMTDIQNQLETWQSQYSQDMQDIFIDWIGGMSDITTTLIAQDPELFEEYDFDPYDWDYEIPVEGCMSSNACNYDPNANVHVSNMCEWPEAGYDCEGNAIGGDDDTDEDECPPGYFQSQYYPYDCVISGGGIDPGGGGDAFTCQGMVCPPGTVLNPSTCECVEGGSDVSE